MKVVFDTNVLIAALITRGVCSDLLEHCVQQHGLVTSNFILDEVRNNLSRRFHYRGRDANAAINLFKSNMEVVKPVELQSPVSRDVDDDKVLGMALAGSADCIVKGDKDLLVIKKYCEIDILMPADFIGYEVEKNR